MTNLKVVKAPKKKKYVGRPTKFKNEYCQMLIDHMTLGYTFESFAGEIEACKDTLYEWARVHKEFSYAKKVATAKCQLCLEKAGQASMYGKVKNFNTTVWIFRMKNQSGWRDKVEMVGEEDYDGFELDES